MAIQNVITGGLSNGNPDSRYAEGRIEAPLASFCGFTSLMRDVKGEDLWGVHAWRVVTAAGASPVGFDELLP